MSPAPSNNCHASGPRQAEKSEMFVQSARGCAASKSGDVCTYAKHGAPQCRTGAPASGAAGVGARHHAAVAEPEYPPRCGWVARGVLVIGGRAADAERNAAPSSGGSVGADSAAQRMQRAAPHDGCCAGTRCHSCGTRGTGRGRWRPRRGARRMQARRSVKGYHYVGFPIWVDLAAGVSRLYLDIADV